MKFETLPDVFVAGQNRAVVVVFSVFADPTPFLEFWRDRLFRLLWRRTPICGVWARRPFGPGWGCGLWHFEGFRGQTAEGLEHWRIDRWIDSLKFSWFEVFSWLSSVFGLRLPARKCKCYETVHFCCDSCVKASQLRVCALHPTSHLEMSRMIRMMRQQKQKAKRENRPVKTSEKVEEVEVCGVCEGQNSQENHT